MKADPDAQRRLLELQAVDSALDRLVARRRALPELAELADVDKQLSEVADEIVRAETVVSDIARDQTKLETEVEMVRSRADRDQKRLDSGQIASARELSNLQSEIASLGRRQTTLEDDLLEVMESGETAEASVAELRARHGELETVHGALTDRRDAAFGEIDTAAEARRVERERLAPTLPADLLTLYDRIRASSGGVGAAALVRRRCEGCHLELSGGDLRAVAAASRDEVVRCEECRRILVRTAESGL
jgi:predicted  nucleic acid-binding Zn-ribbon protein